MRYLPAIISAALLAAGVYVLWRDPSEQYALAVVVGLLVGVVYLVIPERRG